MISIRLSDQEYSVVHEVFRSYGARSVSDFARAALSTFLSRGEGKPAEVLTIESRFAEIDQRLDYLSRRLEQLAAEPPPAHENGRKFAGAASGR